MQDMYQAYTTERGGGGHSNGQDWKVNVFSNAYIDLSKNLESSSEKKNKYFRENHLNAINH